MAFLGCIAAVQLDILDQTQVTLPAHEDAFATLEALDTDKILAQVG